MNLGVSTLLQDEVMSSDLVVEPVNSPAIAPLVAPATESADANETRELKAHIRRLKKYVTELERAADTDPLIPVYNRRAFMRELSRAQSVLDRYDIPCSVVFFDLDGFKSINDRFGHAIGDELLRNVGDTLLKNVRDCDMVARLGGDEFGVLLFRTHQGVAEAKAATLACRIAEIQIDMPTGHVSINTSWGVASCDATQTAEQILARADRSMYMAKTRSG